LVEIGGDTWLFFIGGMPKDVLACPTCKKEYKTKRGLDAHVFKCLPSNTDTEKSEKSNVVTTDSPPTHKSIFEFVVKDIDGKDFQMSSLSGKICLIVNVASKCGRTKSNYTQLVELYDKYHDKGLEILAFPCNQFGSQESGTCETIKGFAQNYNVKFHMMDKIAVNDKGKNTAAPLFSFLKKSSGGAANIPWNFAKFLCDKEGRVVFREDKLQPKTFEEEIKKLLN
jgi:glutathione peroxidase